MIPTITAFAESPDRGRGLARDMPVRWAFEEVGQRYNVRLVSFAEMTDPLHLSLQPFGQIPTYQLGDLALFESAAIVLHIAERHSGLLPEENNARARAITWMFSAVSTVEPVIVQRESAIFMESARPWHSTRLPLVEAQIRGRLRELEARLGDRAWLEGDFTAGDLLMVQVLRRLAGSELLRDFQILLDYIARAEERPAFKRAFAAQLAVFTGTSTGTPAR